MAIMKKINLPTESPVYIGDRTAREMELSVISFDSDSAQMKYLSGVDELFQIQNNSKLSWVNICGLKDVDSINRLGEQYGIHTLSIEDILHTEQQPKIEIFDNYRFLSLKTVQLEKNYHYARNKKPFAFFGRKKEQASETDEFLIDQISLIIMKNVLITFQEIPGSTFAGVRKRMLEGVGDIRKTGTDFLAFMIIDAIVDEYGLTLNRLEDDIEDFEERAAGKSDDTFIEEIQSTKKYLLQMKRAIMPLREIFTVITRHINFFQTDELKPFLQDLNENLSDAIITVESHREWLSNIMEVNLSVLSHQMNKVMKVLATISTIFIPLTFIAGIYGMNFKFMPELDFRFGYPIVLGGMGFIALIMILIFKIRRWF